MLVMADTAWVMVLILTAVFGADGPVAWGLAGGSPLLRPIVVKLGVVIALNFRHILCVIMLVLQGFA